MKKIIETVASYLDKNGLKYFVDEDGDAIHFWRCGEFAQMRMLIRSTMNGSGLNCYAFFPFMAPQAARPAMALRLAKLNYQLSWGNYEMDPEDGEIRFRTAVPVFNGRVAHRSLDYLIQAPSAILDDEATSLMGLCCGATEEAPEEDNSMTQSLGRYTRN